MDWQQFSQWFLEEGATQLSRALIILGAGFIGTRLLGAALTRAFANRSNPQQEMIARRVLISGVWAITLIASLRQLGFELSVLVGAAGVLTVAVGFAAKTAASNIISGMFLMGERPFVLGDVIQVGSTLGEVNAIELLSVRLRTFDNLLVRIPNESLLSSELTNISHFPIRRVDLPLRVAYEADLGALQEQLERIAEEHPLCFESPAPAFVVQALAESAVELRFSAWTARENVAAVKHALFVAVQELLRDGAPGVPYPRRVVSSVPGPELPALATEPA